MKRKLFSLLLLAAVFAMSGCHPIPEPNHDTDPDQQEGEPTDPTDQDPTDDGGKTDPVDPIDPVDPVDPTDPTDPTDPVDPVDSEPSKPDPVDPEPEDEPTLTGISVTEPTKTVYEVGDELDLTGVVVTAYYSDDTDKTVSQSEFTLDSYDMDKLGPQKITIKYGECTDYFYITIKTKREYNELPDSSEEEDISGLINAFANPINNYMSSTETFFNSIGAYDYYRHYKENYIQDRVNFYTELTQYSYSISDETINKGYLNFDNNYYSYSLTGDSINQRLYSMIEQDNLSLMKSDSSYQDDMFTLGDLNQAYFEEKEFTKIGDSKYQTTNSDALNDFANICAPELINTGYYMTFSKVTIEVNPMNNVDFRIRLYTEKVQSGKIIDNHLDEDNKSNWYLLFAEALIYDVNSTDFEPVK